LAADSLLPADVDAEWSRLQAAISDPDDIAEEMQLKMIALNDAIQLYLTVHRAKGSCGEVNYFCAANLFNSMEELFRVF